MHCQLAEPTLSVYEPTVCTWLRCFFQRSRFIIGNMSPESFALSTNEAVDAFAVKAFPHTLVAGPVWTSFEHLRTSGTAGLESIPEHGVATLRSKAGTFRIVRDADFQRLVGLASDICRLQTGLRFVIKAAKVALKHPDKDHVELLIYSASMIAEAPELPQRAGHESFQLTPEEISEESSEDFDLNSATIPRPKW
jgi:hypothetical protein